jgi:hypothetical protein
MPHMPQLFGSLSTLTHVPPHTFGLLPPHVGVQMPALQVEPALQEFLHPPQFLSSVWKSVQVDPHRFGALLPQTIMQAPPMQL